MQMSDDFAPTRPFRLHLLGSARFRCGEVPIDRRLSISTALLFAMLTTRADDWLARDELAFALWPDRTEQEARANLRRHLYLLQQALPQSEPSPLECHKKHVAWIARDRTWVDTNEFERLSKTPDRIEAAIALYGGDFMPLVDHEWAAGMRERLRTTMRRNLEKAMGRCRVEGDSSRALHYAEELLKHDPWREDVLRDFMELRCRIGDRAGALATYHDFRRRLQAELCIDPMPETVRYQEWIMQPA